MNTQEAIRIAVSAAVSAVVAILVVVLVGGSQSVQIIRETTDGIFGADGTRFPNGIAVGGTASPTAGELLINATTTHAGISYEVKGGVDYADTQVSMTATSSAFCVIQNPYGAATTSILGLYSQITANGLAGAAFTYDVSTTTSPTLFASSSPAIVFARTVSAQAQDTMYWGGIGSTSNSYLPNGVWSNVKQDGSSSIILGPSERITWRIATATPGTFTSYLTGTCSASFMKP